MALSLSNLLQKTVKGVSDFQKLTPAQKAKVINAGTQQKSAPSISQPQNLISSPFNTSSVFPSENIVQGQFQILPAVAAEVKFKPPIQQQAPQLSIRASTPEEIQQFDQSAQPDWLEIMREANNKIIGDYQKEQYAKLSPIERTITKNFEAAKVGFAQSLGAADEGDYIAKGLDEKNISQRIFKAGGNLVGFFSGMAFTGDLTTVAGVGIGLLKGASTSLVKGGISRATRQSLVPVISSIAKGTVDMSLFGQLQSFVKGDSWKQHAQRIPEDMVTGALFSTIGIVAGKTVESFAPTASSSLKKILKGTVEGGVFTTIAKVQGADNIDAFIQGVIGFGFGALGYTPRTSAEDIFRISERSLGIKRTATQEEIMSAFQKKAQTIKPNTIDYHRLESSVVNLLYPQRFTQLFEQNKMRLQPKGSVGLRGQEPEKKGIVEQAQEKVAERQISEPSVIPDIQKLEKEIRNESESQILMGLSDMEAGQRIFTEGKVSGISSTFPEWIPADMRTNEFINRALKNMNEGKIGTEKMQEFKQVFDNEVEKNMQFHDLYPFLEEMRGYERTRPLSEREQAELNQAIESLTKKRGTTGIQKSILKQTGITDTTPKVETTQKKLFKQSLRDQARGSRYGYKAGYAEAKANVLEKFREKNATADNARKSVQEYISQILDPQDRGKFLIPLRDAKTLTDVGKAFVRIDLYAQKQQIKKSITDLRNEVEKLSESSSVSADYRNKIKDVVAQYELSGHTEATLQKLRATQEYLERVQLSGTDTEMPQRILEKLKILTRVPKDQLTLSQIEGLRNEVALLAETGKTKLAIKERLYDYEKDFRNNTLLETATPIHSHELGDDPLSNNPKKWMERYIKARNYIQKSHVSIRMIDELADITGMQPMKAALDLNFGNYLTHNDISFKKWYELTKDFTEVEFKRIGIIAAARQEGGVERLANSGFTEKQINEIELTNKEQDAYDFVRNAFEKEYPSVKKYALDVYNEDVGQQKNYVSFLSDYTKMSDLEMYDRFGTRPEEAINLRTKTVEQGFRKERAAISKNKLEINIDKIFRRHMDDVAYMLTMGRDIKMYAEIINSPKMREKLGDVGTLAWLQYLDVMARKGGAEGAKRIAILDIIGNNIGAGVLAFRPTSALIQLTSFSDTLGTIGTEWAVKGASNIATSKEWRNFIMDNFPEIKKAVGDDIAFRELGNGIFARWNEIGLTPLQALDALMRSTAASGAYEKLAFEKGIPVDFTNPDKDLIQEATKLMRYSQGSSFFKDQPLALTSGWGVTDNKSLNKTFFKFQSFMLSRWGNIERQVWRLGIKEKNFKKAAVSLFWMVLVSAAMEEGIRRGTRKVIDSLTGSQTEEETFIKNSVWNIVQSVPVVGQLASAISYSSNPIPVVNVFEDIISGISSTVNGKEGKTKVKGIVRAAGAVGSMLGAGGSSQAAQIINKIISGNKESEKSRVEKRLEIKNDQSRSRTERRKAISQ